MEANGLYQSFEAEVIRRLTIIEPMRTWSDRFGRAVLGGNASSRARRTTGARQIAARIKSGVLDATSLADINTTMRYYGLVLAPRISAAFGTFVEVLPIHPTNATLRKYNRDIEGLAIENDTPYIRPAVREDTTFTNEEIDVTSITVAYPDPLNRIRDYRTRRIEISTRRVLSVQPDVIHIAQGTSIPPLYLDQNDGELFAHMEMDMARWNLQHTAATLECTRHPLDGDSYIAPRYRIQLQGLSWTVRQVNHTFNPGVGYTQQLSCTLVQGDNTPIILPINT